MKKVSSVCVYCAASPKVPKHYDEDAQLLGTLIAQQGYRLVYGGGSTGLMGAVSNAVLEGGGDVTGVMPVHLKDMECYNKNVSDMRFVQTMHERKAIMVAEADAFIILQGGIGTLDELVELLSWRKLGLLDKPVIIVNAGGYWQKFQELLETMMSEDMLPQAFKGNWTMVESVDEAIKVLENAVFERFDLQAHLI